MNLTSKRMLQFLSVCAGAFALTASAQTIWVSDNFEAEGAGLTNAVIGNAAGMYKAYVWDISSQQTATNLAWEAGAGDASTIQAFEGSYTKNTRPIAEANAQEQALKLETEGQTLTRYVAFQDIDDGSGTLGIPLTQPVPISFISAPVYVDTLIKFTPSEDDPEVTDDGVLKAAIFVNASSNLVVCHKFTDGVTFTLTNSVFDAITIDPEQWYRLTIKLAVDATLLTPALEIYLDGTKLTHANGAVDMNTFTGGSLFFALSAGGMGGGNSDLSQVSFQGTGYVDDLVVADYHTPFGGGAGLTLTLVFNDNLLNVFDVNDARV